MSQTIDARTALARLREGNQRFVTDVRSLASLSSSERRAELASGQHPFAIIVGCSDSRAPAELVFDQGLGDLFVIRVAGNVIAPSQVGSVEFAAQAFGTRLVVVMGHTQCGAIGATLEAITSPQASASRGLASIVDRIRPSIEPLVQSGIEGDKLRRQAGRANVRAAANHLRNGSQILEQLRQEEGLLVVGAEYDIESGIVEFFDGVPA